MSDPAEWIWAEVGGVEYGPNLQVAFKFVAPMSQMEFVF